MTLLATHQIESDLLTAGGFSFTRSAPYTRLRGTTWDPRDLAAVNGREKPAAGRCSDYPQPYTEVAVRFDAAIAAEWARRQQWRAERTAPKTYSTSTGTVTMHGLLKTGTFVCLECAQPFMVKRPVSQSRKWPSVCGGCKLHRRRRLAAQRQAKRRKGA